MAEALLNSLGKGCFQAFSAGSHPAGRVHPLALITLESLGISSQGLRSKSWDEFAQLGAPELDLVFTVCDRAAGEVCPIWPTQPMSAHWGVEDPGDQQGSEEERLRRFYEVALILKRRIELMLALPMHALDQLALQRAVGEIGRCR